MKLNKIFIVSIFLLAIIAIGAVSASEEIADDTITAIEPTDEVVADSVEEEPTNIISQPVNEEIEESADSNDELSDISDEFWVSLKDRPVGSDNYVIEIESNSNRNGSLIIYVDDKEKRTLPVTYGRFYEDYWEYELDGEDLDLTTAKDYKIKVAFIEAGSTEENTIKTGTLTIHEMQDIFVDIRWGSDYSIYESTLIYFESNCEKDGMINIYVNNTSKLNITVEDGELIIDGWKYNQYGFSANKLNISSPGIYSIRVTFKDSVTGEEETLAEKNISIISASMNYYFRTIGLDENSVIYIKFPGVKSGTVTIYEYKDDIKGNKIGSSNIVDEMATIEMSGKIANQTKNFIMEFLTDIGNGNNTFSMQTIENVGNVKVTVPTAISAGNNAVVTIKSDYPGYLYLFVDGVLMEYDDISSLKHVIPDLTLGTHNVRIIFYSYKNTMGPGMPGYNALYINSFKITVKAPAPLKVATKIVAAKKTFKVKTKTKKYTITLKAGKKLVKKVKVTLKVGKKTYKATTNTKGKATFKITKLSKKGTYTATIKFAGNKSYKASSKKVKITVKK